MKICASKICLKGRAFLKVLLENKDGSSLVPLLPLQVPAAYLSHFHPLCFLPYLWAGQGRSHSKGGTCVSVMGKAAPSYLFQGRDGRHLETHQLVYE